jgi:Dynamin family
MTATATPEAHAPAAPGLDSVIGELVKVLRALGRDDLVNRATAAGARLHRPSTIVCVVGEFKQSKSSLVNGLLGTEVCPVDDDLATSAITLVRYGEQPSAIVRRRDGEQQVAEQIGVAELGGWVSEQGNPRNEKRVERVEITAPSAILRQGLALVDTPGMGGLGAGHAAATLSFLPFADGLILVSDASAELSAPEVEFLQRAVELCPTVLFAQTKTDLYPEWERIVDINKGHLARASIDVPVVAVSSVLRTEALARRDRGLNELSRFPTLIETLGSQVVQPAKDMAEERSKRDIRGITTLVRSAFDDEKQMLADPSTVKRALADLQAATERLEHLRGPGAKWSVVVGDRVADLSNDVSYTFRGGMRAVSRVMDELVENLKTGEQWDNMVRQMQAQVADEVTRVFVAIEQGRADIRAEVATLLQDEHLSLPTPRGGHDDAIDVGELWQGKALDETSRKEKLTAGLTGLRGAQGGVVMFGMMGQFLPAVAATILASNPVLLGAGALFGGLQLSEDRKRKVAARRQSARQQVRQFMDDVQFEVTNEMTQMLRDLQRDLRDEFGERLGELQRTYTDTAQRAQKIAAQTQEQSKKRVAEIEAASAVLMKVAALAGSSEGGR